MAKKRVGKYPLPFRQMAVERMRDCPSVSALAKDLGIDRSNMYQWQRQLEHASESSARVTSPIRELRKQVRELQRVLAEKTLEVDFFQRRLAKSGGSAPGQQRLWRDGIYDQIQEVMPMQGSFSIERMCLLAGVSRAGFYRYLKAQVPSEEETEVRSAIQQVALQHRRRYGYRRVTAELKRRGMQVNHKRVARIMREDNLLALQPKEFATTTDSNESLEVYLNLSRRMQLNWVDQLWVADITYIRVQTEFVYLAVILDSYSRKVVGWKLDRSLTSRLAADALNSAIKLRRPPPGIVHHSDRGVQYTSPEYIAILQRHGMVQSMSRPANPYDNASCESFIKTLKREEIYANRYRDLDDLHSHIEEFIDGYYNQKRLHSALGYQTPEEYEAQKQVKTEAELYAPTLRFSSPGPQEAKKSTENAGVKHRSFPNIPLRIGWLPS